MKSFIVEFWSRLFGALGKLSLFSFLGWLWPSLMTARFVDAWVLGHLCLALAAVFVVSQLPHSHPLAIGLVVYGFLRVIEIAVYQLNVLLFDEYRAIKQGKEYAIEGYRRIVLLLLHNYAEIILWLGCTYIVLANEYAHKWEGGTHTALGGIYSSFITMTTFGEFDLLPKSDLAAVVLLFHATVGLFMTLLSLARFISLIPPPKSRDPIELRQIALSSVEPKPTNAKRRRR